MGCTVMICGTACRRLARTDHEEARKRLGETKHRLETYLQDVDCVISKRTEGFKHTRADVDIGTALTVANSNSVQAYREKRYEDFFGHETFIRFLIGQMFSRVSEFAFPFDRWRVSGGGTTAPTSEPTISRYLTANQPDGRSNDFMFDLYGACYLKVISELSVCKPDEAALSFHHTSIAYDLLASLVEYNNTCPPYVTSEDIIEGIPD